MRIGLAENAGHAISVDLARTWQSTKILVASPAHASANDLHWTGRAVGVVLASSLLDRTMASESRGWDEPWQTRISDFGRTYQKSYVIFGSAALAYGAGLAANRTAWRRTGMEIVQAWSISGAGTFLVKSALGRSRPDHADGPYEFHGPGLRDKYHSFPSGDVTEAFALSSVLAAEIPNWPARVGLYALAAATAFQRLDSNRHWLSDTVGAAVWGTAVGWGVVTINRKLKIENRKL